MEERTVACRTSLGHKSHNSSLRARERECVFEPHNVILLKSVKKKIENVSAV